MKVIKKWQQVGGQETRTLGQYTTEKVKKYYIIGETKGKRSARAHS